ncbi:MAG: sugar-binding protein, partial [Ignavibacteriaceae bacterium]
FRIPFEYINEMQDNRFMVDRVEGEVFGLGINVGDNDSGARDHMIQWSAAHADSVHSRPIGLGSATFMANNVVKLEAVSPRDPAIVNPNADDWYTPPALTFAINIDAEKDEFYETLTGPENGYVYIPMRSYLTEIGTPPDDDADLSARVWFAWDEDYLYCYGEVKDDVVSGAAGDRFSNDCIELKFDPDPSSGEGNGTANARITGIGYDMGFDSVGVDNVNGSGHLEDAAGNDWVVTAGDYARRITSDGYVVEFRIPFEYINEMQDNRFMVDRVEGEVFGLGINVGDNDSGARDHMIQWSAAHADSVHSRPIGLGSATFMANNVIKLEAVSPRDPAVVNDSADVWYNPGVVGVKTEPAIAKDYYLSQNYPNPFNPNTNIQFSIPGSEFVSLKIYNSLGQEVEQLISEEMNAGVYTAVWDASKLASGIYYYQIKAGQFVQTRKLVLLK